MKQTALNPVAYWDMYTLESFTNSLSRSRRAYLVVEVVEFKPVNAKTRTIR